MSDELRRAFGLAVSGARDRRKKSQRQLATEARLNRSYLSRIETGLADPTLTIQDRIASALGLTPVRLAELVGEERRRLRLEADDVASRAKEATGDSALTDA
jgi:transcriptional regulator with XRE-family HTH domain